MWLGMLILISLKSGRSKHFRMFIKRNAHARTRTRTQEHINKGSIWSTTILFVIHLADLSPILLLPNYLTPSVNEIFLFRKDIHLIEALFYTL